MGWLKSWLESDQEKIWQQIAEDLGGEYIDGGFWERNLLRYQTGPWEIILDSYTANSARNVYTRMRAPFVNQDGLAFKIYRPGLLDAIGQYMGLQDIQTGDAFFDQAFVIKGNQPEKIQRLLQDPQLKSRIQLQPDICFEIRDDAGLFAGQFPAGVDVLSFQCQGLLTEVRLLKNLFELFSLTLANLASMDPACQQDPQIRI